MTRKQFIEELRGLGVPAEYRVRFHARSPYQSRRYKPEFVGWEAWVYGPGFRHGYLITQEDWEFGDHDLIVKTLLN